MPVKFDRCVKKVKAKSKGKYNAYAVCQSSIYGKGKKLKKAR